MDWDRVEGNWKVFKGKAKEKWGKLTDDDLHSIEGGLKLTAAEVASISSSANTQFEAAALELSKKIEQVANTVSDSE
ncbi:MAG: hypothetical protein QOJ86_5485 [Bradyrhizobium sp.]|nr:hypothetical protein [Bradyrhizobium sp.]